MFDKNLTASIDKDLRSGMLTDDITAKYQEEGYRQTDINESLFFLRHQDVPYSSVPTTTDVTVSPTKSKDDFKILYPEGGLFKGTSDDQAGRGAVYNATAAVVIVCVLAMLALYSIVPLGITHQDWFIKFVEQSSLLTDLAKLWNDFF